MYGCVSGLIFKIGQIDIKTSNSDFFSMKINLVVNYEVFVFYIFPVFIF